MAVGADKGHVIAKSAGVTKFGRFATDAMRAAVTVGPVMGPALIVGGLTAAWAGNLAVGGADTIPPHAFYLPILFAGIRFGPVGAALTALAAGVLAGPLLPADVATGATQTATDWIVRGVFFVVLGQLMTGLVAATVGDLHDQLDALHAEHELAAALRHRDLYLVYQPIVSLDHDPRIVGVEALLRWRHPERGEIQPGEFIELAERSGLIVLIGRWALHEACRQVQTWRRDILGDTPYFKLAVNVSTIQLAEIHFPDEVADVVNLSGLPASWLHLEVTETALITDVELSATHLQRVKQVGVSIAIDDFGTGYGSLTYIHRFPVDVIKIDRSFVADIAKGPAASALAGGIVMLARSLGICTVAEGIETAAQADILRNLGCDLGQGWYFGRPKPPADIERLLRAQQHITDTEVPSAAASLRHVASDAKEIGTRR